MLFSKKICFKYIFNELFSNINTWILGYKQYEKATMSFKKIMIIYLFYFKF